MHQQNTHRDENFILSKKKAALRQEAIDWQADFAAHNYSWWDIADYENDFEARARKYGLIREFRENGII